MAIYRPIVLLALLLVAAAISRPCRGAHDYGDALSKSILFFEGQRSGRLPAGQRLTWRRDSALHDGAQDGVSSPLTFIIFVKKVSFVFLLTVPLTR